MLIWVASYPRSGNTLTLLTLHTAFSVDAIGAASASDLGVGRHLQQLLPAVVRAPWPLPAELHGLEGDELVAALKRRPEPYFVKTHRRLDAGDDAPALYVVRDGRDAIVSYAHFAAARGVSRLDGLSFEERVERLIHPGLPAHGSWSENVAAWRTRSAPVAIVRFEDLLEDPAAAVRRACEELSVPLGAPQGAPPDFDDLHRRMPDVFRQGTIGAWRDELTPALHDRFWRFHETEMEALGYAREGAVQWTPSST